MWVHDLYEENDQESEEDTQIQERDVDPSNPGKVMLKNLSYEIIEDKLKVDNTFLVTDVAGNL